MTGPIDRLAAALSDRYRLERELGSGGMATVYLAEDLKHDRKVAIKVLKPDLAAVLGAERFIAEIKTTAALSHPHILPLFDSGEADSFLFYVMPYIEGETIREKLTRETQFGIEEAVRITREVADALDYAHRHGVIHRDIKPENFLLHDGRAMVMDFGIALAVSAAAGGRMTETGLSLGTPHYMSPEQATADKQITGRSDIYSLASVLYEMLAGEPPHMGNSAQQIIMKIVTDVPRPVGELRKAVPPNVAAAVAKSLEKLPADRFESARAFAEALANPGFTVVRSAAGTASPARAARRLAPWGLAAVLAVALAAALLWRGAADQSPPPALAFELESAGDGIVPFGVALSPDGRDLVFAGRGSGETRLYHRELGTPGIRPLPRTEGVEGVFIIRPDRSVVFWVDRAIHTLSLDGGAPVRYAGVGNFPAGMAWSERSGLVLGMITMRRPNGLSRLARGDSAPTAITELPEGGMHHDPMLLDGGTRAIFTSFGRGLSASGTAIGVASLEDGTWERFEVSLPPRRLIGLREDVLLYLSSAGLTAVRWDGRQQRPVGEPILVPGIPEGVSDATLAEDGTLALVAPAGGRGEVVLVDLAGQVTPLLPGEAVPGFQPRFDPAGTRVAFHGRRGNNAEIRILALDDLVAQTLSFGPSSFFTSIAWTRDGRVAAIREEALAANPRVLVRPADGSDSSRVLYQPDPGSGRLSGLDLSPDGRWLALVTMPRQSTTFTSDIVLRDLDSAGSERPVATSPADEVAPRFSPDGRWLAYASDESGRYEVYVRSTAGAALLQVSDGGGGQPVWSARGDRLFYRSGAAMMAADLVATPAGGLGVSARRRLFEILSEGDESAPMAMYDVSHDGRFIMARMVGVAPSPIQVRTGWLAGLKAQLAARP